MLGTFPPAAESSALAALQAQLGDALSYVAVPAPTLRYCPDNTCESFKGPPHAHQADLADFALLYLWRVSDYDYLKSWREGPTPAAIEGAINRHRPGCAPASEPARIACALRNLSRGARIIVYTVRYDEGHVAEDRVDLEKGLARLK